MGFAVAQPNLLTDAARLAVRSMPFTRRFLHTVEDRGSYRLWRRSYLVLGEPLLVTAGSNKGSQRSSAGDHDSPASVGLTNCEDRLRHRVEIDVGIAVEDSVESARVELPHPP